MDEDVLDSLRLAYDRSAAKRDAAGLPAWKMAERADFLALLRAGGKRSLLEIGAGPGHFGAYFRDAGFDVTCTDLSPEMVRLCRAKGLRADVMNYLDLAFPAASFGAVFALNCLLHAPSAELPRALTEVHRVLRPGGLFFYGVYGGWSFEGVWPDDHHDPKRYFTFYPDEELQRHVSGLFEIISFRQVALEAEARGHFQSLILRPKELS